MPDTDREREPRALSDTYPGIDADAVSERPHRAVARLDPDAFARAAKPFTDLGAAAEHVARAAKPFADAYLAGARALAQRLADDNLARRRAAAHRPIDALGEGRALGDEPRGR